MFVHHHKHLDLGSGQALEGMFSNTLKEQRMRQPVFLDDPLIGLAATHRDTCAMPGEMEPPVSGGTAAD